ncbi:MAG: hypothetical protein LBS46_04695 [Dysgonamonadaceae bacterium]|jgi:hypothetical protein|nr:hypothetical protein [Dysgonamonadaceae bacterium]
MKILQNNRKILGLLLAFLLVLPLAIRVKHVFHCSVQDNDGRLYHDCTNCTICCFAFSLFTENESFESEILSKYVEYEIPVFDSQIIASFPFSYHLRAPPSI